MPDFASPPTAELHVHIEGTFEPAAILEVATRNDLPRPADSLEELAARYSFSDLQSFLDLYYANLSVLRTAEDFYDLASAYLGRAKLANVRRAEIFFDPQSHLANGIPIEAVFEGLSSAVAEAQESHGVSADLILCFLRHLGADAADETLTAALPFRDRFIGIGLDSTEIGFPPEQFKAVYERALAEGLHLVAHAGEEGGPETVSAALDVLHVERIDHGIRAAEDPDLLDRLAAEKIPLTVCPLSNVALKAVPSLAAHPLPNLIAAGVTVCINSDDPPYFGGYVDQNYEALSTELEFSTDQLANLALMSFDAAFIGDAERAQWKAAVREWADEAAGS
jgi:adenosine deaminase